MDSVPLSTDLLENCLPACDEGVPEVLNGSKSLELPDGERWEFHCDGLEVEVEDSILFSSTRGNRKTDQIVVHGRCQQTQSVRWQMHRTAVGGNRRRLAAPETTRLPART